MEVRAVFFDVGETLVDETRLWEAWAATLGIPRFTFMAVVGGIIARGEHHDRVFQVLAPGFEPRFDDERFGLEDFYPDALPCLERLRASGFIVGMAGNQSSTLEQVLRDLGLSLDIIAIGGVAGGREALAGVLWAPRSDGLAWTPGSVPTSVTGSTTMSCRPERPGWWVCC